MHGWRAEMLVDLVPMCMQVCNAVVHCRHVKKMLGSQAQSRTNLDASTMILKRAAWRLKRCLERQKGCTQPLMQ
jgi:hypothetical protein